MEKKLPFLRRLVLDRKIHGLKPSKTFKRGIFKRVYQYDINTYRQYKETLGRVKTNTKVISCFGIN